MGFYLNPEDCSKEQYLEEKGELLSEKVPNWNEIPKGKVVICLVDNGPFTAAAIMYSEGEFDVWKSPSDERPMEWYLLSEEDAKAVSGW